MNELFDKLFLRIILAITLCLIVVIYKYAHALFYPPARSQLFKKFYPVKNPADTFHFFSRIVGIGIIFSGLYFNLEDGLFYALLGFLIESIISFSLYLLSLYILESITLFNFEYSDEITKRKNLCYATINCAQAITVAMIIRAVIINSNYSLISLLFLWSLAIVLFGLSTKFYKFLSKLSFNKLLIHKNMALAFSYSGHLFGSSVIIISAMDQELTSIEGYSLQVLLKIILSLIILPIFQKGLIWVFRIQVDSADYELQGESNVIDGKTKEGEVVGPSIGHGIYEGSIFFTSCYLTSVITGNIFFGNFYPVY